jgi:hypothetical protein
MDMQIDPTQIELTPKLRLAIAHYANLEGKQWEEVLEDRFPLLEEPTEAELAESLAMCDQGIADAQAGKGTDAKVAITEIANRLGLNPPQ